MEKRNPHRTTSLSVCPSVKTIYHKIVWRYQVEKNIIYLGQCLCIFLISTSSSLDQRFQPNKLLRFTIFHTSISRYIIYLNLNSQPPRSARHMPILNKEALELTGMKCSKKRVYILRCVEVCLIYYLLGRGLEKFSCSGLHPPNVMQPKTHFSVVLFYPLLEI